MTENLAVTKDRDGNDPRLGIDYFYPDDDESNVEKYGLLYTWKAAMRIAPKGWHLPSDDEWKQMEVNAGMSQSDADGGWVRGKFAAKLCANSGWKSSNSDNAAGNLNAPDRNTSGFSALPAGHYYWISCEFGHVGEEAHFWSATEYMGDYVYRAAACTTIVPV